jgi:hypothetical protein
MGISMNPKMSGFRKWAEIHEPTKIDEAGTGAKEGGVTAAADVRQDGKTADPATASSVARSRGGYALIRIRGRKETAHAERLG